MQDLEQSVRERAYQLWIESGCQGGQADAHWLAAQREILSASLDAIDTEQQAAERPAKPKAKATRKKRVV